MKCTLKINRFPQAKAAIHNELLIRLERAANNLRDALRRDLESGRFDLHTDTGTTAEALYVQSAQGSDYAERLTAAAARYVSESGFWLEPVRNTVAPDAYTAGHFAARAAPEEPLQQEANYAKAMVACLFVVGLLWEIGHYNAFTERDEHRPWMQPGALDWAFAHLAQHFENLLP